MNIHLLVPGFSPAQKEGGHGLLNTFLGMFNSPRRLSERESSYTSLLVDLFNIPADTSDFPAASFVSLSMGWNPSGTICVSPVCLEAGIEKIFLRTFCDAQIDTDESTQVLEAINQHFQVDGLTVKCVTPSLWLLVAPGLSEVQTTPLYEVSNESIYAALPTGNEATVWRQFLTESQMLLHTHSVNQLRESRGVYPINGLWVWGNGELPDKADKPPWDCIVTDSTVVAGIAKWCGLPALSLNKFYQCIGRYREPLLIVEEFMQCNSGLESPTADDSLKGFEINIIKPIMQGIDSREVKRVHFQYADGQAIWKLKPRWKFW